MSSKQRILDDAKLVAKNLTKSKQKPKISLWSQMRKGPLKVAIIGSGNWGSAIAKVIGENAKGCHIFEEKVNMWVYEEMFEGKKLSEIINTTHENKKYLPGIKLPDNIVAVPNVRDTVKGAALLVFVLPHQFVESVCKQLDGLIEPGAKAISLVKGFEVSPNELHLISHVVKKSLNIECCALSGANVAEDVAKEQFAETTIGYEDVDTAAVFQQLFDTPYFRVNVVPGPEGVEICGALKNVVALAAGFSDGLGLGSNTKSALLRLGMEEIRRFTKSFYPNVNDDTFWDSCGIADLITTAFAGRNRKCAEAFVKTGKSWAVIEKEMLGGQKLQGTLTTREIVEFLKAKGTHLQYPLFNTVYDIVQGDAPPERIISCFMGKEPRPIISKL